MTAEHIVNALLETDEYVGDPSQYAIGAADKSYWSNPHPWVHQLRSLGFQLKHHEYQPKDGPKIEYWGSERKVKLKSGEVLDVSLSGYDQPDMQGQAAVDIRYHPHWRDDSSHVFNSRPLKPNEIKRVVADIIRRLERLEVEPASLFGGSYTGGVAEAVGKALAVYEYWRNERRVKKV